MGSPVSNDANNNEAASAKTNFTASAVVKLVEAGRDAVNQELNSVLTDVESSQNALHAELHALCTEMDRISGQVGHIGVDERMQQILTECKESLARTKSTLKTVNGRMTRLRSLDEAQELRGTEVERK